MLELLAHSPLLLLAVLLLLGSLLGQLRIAGAHLGPAAVLFVALALTAWGVTRGVHLTVPEILGSFGLILFTYSIGIISGPNFFGSLRRGWPAMLATVACLGVAAAVALGLGALLDLPRPVIAGTYAGALTNTPALAAAGQAAGETEQPAIGYSISYLFGVVGMMLAAGWALRRAREDGPAAPRLEQSTIRIDRTAGTVADIVARHHGAVTVTRIRTGEGSIRVPASDDIPAPGDLVSAIGSGPALAALTTELGHASTRDLIGDRSRLDSNRITVSTGSLAGRRISDLGLTERFGAQVSRVRRGDVDMIPAADFIVQMGDRLRVVAPRDQLRAIRRHLGDSERGFSDINPVGLALGLALGVAVGMIQVPLPSGSFTLGSAAGTLLVGLIFGRFGRLGRLPVSMSASAAHSLSSLGMLVFLAYAGTKAGTLFADAVRSSLGWKVAVVGAAITLVAAASLLIVGRLQRTDWIRLSGQLGGAQTQPAVLAYANTRTGFDNRVALGYALVYPAAMIAKILFAQLLVLI